MGRAALAAVAALATLAVAERAAAHPGHGADAITIAGDQFTYTPASVTVGVGDTVIWFWQGSLFRNHSVTADPGQAEQFDSDPNTLPSNAGHPPGDSFSHFFTEEGRFTYHCKVHSTMRGTVEVVDLAAGARPRLRELRVSPAKVCGAGKRECTRGPARARFRLTRAADVVGRISRLGPRARLVETFSVRGRRGLNEVKLPSAALGRGRYELRLVAYDAADQRSNTLRERFAVR